MNMQYELTTPCTAQDLAPLQAGDTVLLSGVVYTARDQAHKRMLEALDRGEPLPFDLEGSEHALEKSVLHSVVLHTLRCECLAKGIVLFYGHALIIEQIDGGSAIEGLDERVHSLLFFNYSFHGVSYRVSAISSLMPGAIVADNVRLLM